MGAWVQLCVAPIVFLFLYSTILMSGIHLGGSPKLFLFQGFQWLMLSQTEQIPNDNISSKDCVNFHFGTCALSFHKKHFWREIIYKPTRYPVRVLLNHRFGSFDSKPSAVSIVTNLLSRLILFSAKYDFKIPCKS